MSEASSETNPLDRLAEEFVARQRRGERPSVTEYVARFPALAEEIRELFPALALMEDVRPESAKGTQEHSPHDPADDAPRPERLGDYRVLREVGRGGMGVVYEAEQESLGRHVALKVLPAAALLNPKHLLRFQREAKAAARLHHTNIVPVYGVGEDGGLYYYVMQFIQGLGLDEVLVELQRLRQAREAAPDRQPEPTRQDAEPRRNDLSAVAVARSLLTGGFAPAAAAGPPPGAQSDPAGETPRTTFTDSSVHLPGQTEGSGLSESGRAYWRSVARIGIQVADALAYAHAQGTLHRDIKPSNLLLDAQANVWVTDFGLAKAAADSDHLTHSGDVVGTLRYLPPERFSGKDDARGDVYSLGLTLYELLALRPAYAETDREQLLRQVMHGEPPRLRKVSPLVPRDLETIVLKATERDPGRRYATAAELAEDLKRFVEDRPIRARRVGPVEWLWRWARRNPVVAGLTTAVVGLLIAAAVGAMVAALREQSLRVAAQQTAATERETRQQLEHTLYFERIALADQKLAADHRDQVEELLEQCPAGFRGWEWDYLKHWLQAEPYVELRGHTSWLVCVAFHPDGRRLASADSTGPIRIWERTTGKQARPPLFGHFGTVASLAFSPDGRYLGSASDDRTVKIWDADTGQVLHTLRGHEGGVLWMAFSPDSRLVASASWDKTIRIWEVATGRQVRICPGHEVEVAGVAFSPDGSRLASISNDGTIKIWDVATGDQTLSWREVAAGALAFSPDGQRLAVASGREVHILTVDDGRLERALQGHFMPVFNLAYSPAGRRLATASWDNTAKLWDPETGREILTFRGHTDTVRGIAFSPDGRHLATASYDQTVRVWDATGAAEGAGGLVRTVRFSRDRNEYSFYLFPHPSFHPDGQRVAVAYRDGTVRLWDLGTAQEVAVFHLHDLPVYTTRFSPDGSRLTAADIHGDVKVWDVATGREVWAGPGGNGPGLGVLAFSPDNRSLVFGEVTGAMTIWDVSKGGKLKSLHHPGGMIFVDFSGDGRLFASCGPGKKVKVWKMDGFEELWTLEHPDVVIYLRFSPEGRRLATAGNDRAVRLWDLETGKEVSTFRGHKEPVTDVDFSPDGRLLASVGFTEALVRAATDGRVMRRFRGHPGMVVSARFSPDGQRLIASGDDATLKVWDAALSPLDWHGPEARRLVEERFARLLLRSDVVDSLRADQAIPDEVRAVALQLAEEHDEDPKLIDAAVWAVVKDRVGDPAAYRLALRRAEAAGPPVPREQGVPQHPGPRPLPARAVPRGRGGAAGVRTAQHGPLRRALAEGPGPARPVATSGGPAQRGPHDGGPAARIAQGPQVDLQSRRDALAARDRGTAGAERG